jgi:hypothetical protein
LPSISLLGNHPQTECLDRTLAKTVAARERSPAANCPVLFLAAARSRLHQRP